MPLNVMNGEDTFARAIHQHSSGNYQEAERLYRQVLQFDQKHAGALQNLGVLAFQVGRQDAAIPLLKRAVELAPNNASIYCNLGDAYTAMRQGDDALAAYKKAVEIDPNMATTYNNLGIVYSRLGRVEDAINAWKKAIELANRPLAGQRVLVGHGSGGKAGNEQNMLIAAAYNNLGNAYLQQIELDKALECHRKACELNSGYANARSNMLRDYTHIPNIPPQKLLEEHKKWWDIHGNVPRMTHNNTPDPNRKLRIGFMSADFREHSVTHFLLPLFENYNRDQFDFYCYAGVSRPDEFTQMLARCAPNWRNSLSAGDVELAKLIQQDQVDILFDLSGHTSDHRLAVFAHKPAPVQATFLGYPMTSGSPVIDWRFADPMCDPPGVTDSHYSERLIRMPKTMWCYRPPVNIPCQEAPACVRNPNAPFTFGSFNNCSKMSDITFRLWANTVLAAPGSRLVIKASAMADANTRRMIHEKFAKHGLPSERVILVTQQIDLAQHFAYYGNIDLGLDTYTYCGTTTTCEAMWMNVPVVTLVGEMHISRVGSSLLTSMGLPQLIAHSEEEFVKIASGYAANRDSLVELRKGLRARMQASPLMDGKQYAKDFGDCLRTMWADWCERRKAGKV